MISTFKCLKLAGLLIVTGVALSACKTTGSLSGQGDLKLSKGAAQYFLNSYMKEQYPLAFAVSEDGVYTSYRLCSAIKCRGSATTTYRAIKGCEQRSNQKCSLFARRKEIVWTHANGQTFTMDEVEAAAYGKNLTSLNTNMGAASLSNISLCKKALSTNPNKWSLSTQAVPFVTEAKKRDMKINFCAKITGRG